jgi:hypothetical protein
MGASPDEALGRESLSSHSSCLMFLKEKWDSFEDTHVCRQAQAEKQHLVKAGDYIADGGNRIGVHHRRYRLAQGSGVACFGIMGAFLHVDVDEDITMVLKGRLRTEQLRKLGNYSLTNYITDSVLLFNSALESGI